MASTEYASCTYIKILYLNFYNGCLLGLESCDLNRMLRVYWRLKSVSEKKRKKHVIEQHKTCSLKTLGR